MWTDAHLTPSHLSGENGNRTAISLGHFSRETGELLASTLSLGIYIWNALGRKKHAHNVINVINAFYPIWDSETAMNTDRVLRQKPNLPNFPYVTATKVKLFSF